MYIFGGNDVNRTFADLWRISLRDIVNSVDKQWEMEHAENIPMSRGKGAGTGAKKAENEPSTVPAPVPVPYKAPRWQLMCRDSSLVGK